MVATTAVGFRSWVDSAESNGLGEPLLNALAIKIPTGRLLVHANHAVLNDAILDLSPTNLSILKLLALSPGAVITRHQILQAIPGRATTAHAADVCISRVREALGDKTTVETVIKQALKHL